MSKVSYYTAEGLKKLRDELNQLKDVERPRASQAIADARDKGDLSENAEYDAAKEAQGMLEMRIAKMEETLSNARLIDESQLDTSKILVHSTVKIKNKANGAEMTYKLVAQSEADLKADIRARGVSNLHPVGTCRMGREVDAVVDPQLRVHGIGNLRVADASIMPSIVAGNTNAPSIMIGEKCADMVRANSR